MPNFVAGFAAFFTGGTVVGLSGTLGFIAAAATFNAALGAIARKLTSKKGGEDTGIRQQREVTVRATDAYDGFVYGRALVGGVTVYHNGIPDSDGFNSRMHHVVKWAGHECTSIELFRLDDRTLDPDNATIDWDPTSYTGTGRVDTGEFRGTAANSAPTYMRWYLGNQSSADARLASQADEWTVDHLGGGQTYGVLEIWQVDGGEQTSKVYQKGFPNNIAAYLHGKKVYDHRRYALNRDPSLTQLNSWWFAPVDITSMGDSIPASFWTTTQGVGGTNDIAARVESAGIAFENGHRLLTDVVPVHPDSAYTLTFRVRQTADATVPTFVQAYQSDESSAGNVFPGNVSPTGDWQEVVTTFGAGTSDTLPSSARFVRAGISSPRSATAPSNIDIQDMAVYLGTGSRHLVNVASTWQYSESPPFCVADYLKDERLGFGKRLRVPINPSLYARNTDPGFRRENTLGVSSYWCIADSDGSGVVSSGTHIPLRSYGSLNLEQTGAPVGRRALVVAGSGGSAASGVWAFSDPVPVDASGFYNLSAQARQDGAKGARFLAAFYDGNGAHIHGNSSDASGWAGIGTFHYWVTANDAALPSIWSNFTTILGSGEMSIPSCASFVRVGMLSVTSQGANGDTQQYFQDYRLMVGTQDRHFIEPHEQIFWPSVSSAAGYTDALVATPSGDQVRFACNGAGHTGAGHRSNIRNLLSSFNGRAVYVQSGFHITAGWEEPTKTLNKSDFRSGGTLKVRAKAELLDRYNHVRGTFYDPENEYKRVPMATVTADEYIARDSSQQLFHDVHLPYTNDWFGAQRVAFGILEQGDNQQLVEFQLKHSALDLMPGKVVGINHDVVSWTNHTLRMVDMETDLKKGIRLFGREDYEASYVDVGTSEYFSRQFNGVTSAAPIVPQVSSVTVTPRDGGIQLHWNNPAARSFEWIDVYRRTTNAFSGSTLIKSTRNDEYFDTLDAGQTQHYWFQTRDFANNVSSVFPGLTSSFSTAALFPVARDPEYVFFEEFRYQSLAEFEQKWERVSGDGDITFINTGTVGGKVLQSSGRAWWASRIRIPYDPDALYQTTVKVRQTAGAADEFFCGFTGFRADGATPISVVSEETLGAAHWFVRDDHDLTSQDLWVEFTGHVRGHMPWPRSGTLQQNISQDPKLAARMHDLVKYASPTFILNNSQTGVAQLDYISVRKLIPFRTVTFDPEITAQSNWLNIPVVGIGAGAGNVDPSSITVASLVNVNIDGEYSVLALTNEMGNDDYYIAERFRPGFHPRMPSSGAYMGSIMARVTSDSNIQQVRFSVALIAYTRTGSFVNDYRGLARLTIGSDSSLGPGGNFNQWHEASGTIRVSSDGAVNPNSGPYFLAPAVHISGSPTDIHSLGGFSSSWIAYLNITAGNP